VAYAEEIALVREGGVYHLPVTLNGQLTVNFVIDTGASETTIPADVAMVLIRTGTVSDRDSLGSATYALADGSLVENARIRLESLQIGRTTLRDVAVSVGGPTSSLLLGQNVLRRLEPWHMDTRRQRFVRSGEARLADAYAANASSGQHGTLAQRVKAFVQERLLASSSSDIDAFLRLYAGRVDYYDLGLVGVDAIRKDKSAYFKRWPQRDYQLAGPIDIERNANGSISVRYDTHFSVYSPRRDHSVNGRSRESLTLRDGGSGFRISAESSRVVERR
jgi:clan AA aspartic protease (TIGR02281 family)